MKFDQEFVIRPLFRTLNPRLRCAIGNVWDSCLPTSISISTSTSVSNSTVRVTNIKSPKHQSKKVGDKGLVSMKNHCFIEWLRDWCGTFGENEDVVFKSGDSLDIKKTNHKNEDFREFLWASGKHKCCEIKI